MTRNILLAEDDENMRFMVQDNLEIAGYKVCALGDGQTALSAFMKQEFSICILDVMLPKKDGFRLASDIRKLNNQVPIIFLTARNLKEDRINGFRLGADDYITKPFSIEELLLRIEAIFKRVYKVPSGSDKNSRYELGDIVFDFDQQKILVHNTVVALTAKEAKLLRLFCIHRNKVIERDIILKAIWEDEGYFVGRSMDVFVSRLRKIFKDSDRISIQTIHGVGYKLSIDQALV
ncbi:MAG: response regulator transcription factor [Chryseolinea sp.]